MTEATKDRFQTDFDALPLEEKIKTLFKLEASTLTETFNYAVNEPMKVVEKFGEMVSEFGSKIEAEIKKAAQHRKESCEPPSVDPQTAERDPAQAAAAAGSAKSGKKPKPKA